MKNRGSILIASLWALSIFSVMMTSITFEGFQHINLMKRELNMLHSKAEFQSALTLFAEALLSDPKPHEDSKEDSWYGTLVLPESWKEEFEISIQDEESKINLNFASEEFLKTFLKTFEEEMNPLQMEEKDFVKKLIKLRAKTRISSFEELYLIEDVESEDLDKLRPYMSVYPETAQMNINTIDPLVLKSLIRLLSNDHFAGEELFGRLTEYREKVKTGEATPLTHDDLTPNAFLGRLSLSPKLTTVSLVNRFLPLMTTDSRTYHLKIKLESGKKVEAVAKDSIRGPGIDILSWNET